MRYLDVCSGYSAPTIAWQGLGFECAGYAEIEAFPRAVLEQRHGAVAVDWDHQHRDGANVVPLFHDFTKIEASHVGPVQLLVGGTPCQAFSIAGKRLGLDDPRGNLTLEFLALAGRLRPQWVVWENVPGVLSDDGGRTMGTFLRILGQLGYGWAYRVLDAQYVRVGMFGRAVPQRRRRVFVVGCLGDQARAAAILFDGASLRGDPAPRRQSGEGAAPPLAARTRGGGGHGTDFDIDGGLVANTLTTGASRRRGSGQLDNGNIVGVPAVADTLRSGSTSEASHGKVNGTDRVTLVAEVAGTMPSGGNRTGGTRPPGMGQETADSMLVAHTLRGEGFDASEDGSGRGTPLTVEVAHALNAHHYGRMDVTTETLIPFDTTQLTNSTNASNPQPGAPCHTLAKGQHPPAVAFSVRGRDGEPVAEAAPDGVSHALRTVGGGSSHSFVATGGEVVRPLMASHDGGTDAFRGMDVIGNGFQVRRLTPRECERLQGLPDDFTAITFRGKPASDSARYKAIGNSMACNVMRWIGERIAFVDAIEGEKA